MREEGGEALPPLAQMLEAMRYAGIHRIYEWLALPDEERELWEEHWQNEATGSYRVR